MLVSSCPLLSLSHAFFPSPTSTRHSSPPKSASLCIFTSWPDAWILLGVVRGMQVLWHHSDLMQMLPFFLGPRGPLGSPSFARPSVRGQEKSGSAV